MKHGTKIYNTHEMERVAFPRAAMIGRLPSALFLALPLLIFCGSATVAAASWREELDHAGQLFEEGKNTESVAAAQRALADAEKNFGPESSEIIHILARLSEFYEARGDPARLAEMEKRLSAIKSKNFEAWLALGRLLRFEEKSPEAENALKKALAFNAGDSDAEYELILVYDDMGRFEEEARLLKERIEKKDTEKSFKKYSIYSQLARVYTRLGRSAEAKEAFAQAKKSDGATPDAYIQEGYFHLDVGEPAQAKKAFESAIAVDTSSPIGYHHMGSYLSKNSQYPEAEKYFRQALERLEANRKYRGGLNTRTDDLIHTVGMLGDAIELQGRFSEAEAVYRKCLELEDEPTPNGIYMRCLQALGKIYVSQDKYALAEDILKREAAVCEEGPACSCSGRSLIELGTVYLKQGRRREAADMADQAGKLCSGPNSSELSLLAELAGLYVRLGDVSTGEALYGRVLAVGRLRPFNIELDWLLGLMAELKMTQGRFHEAEDLYRQAIPIAKNRHDGQQEAAALDGLATACEKEGKPQEAAEAREKAKALRSDKETMDRRPVAPWPVGNRRAPDAMPAPEREMGVPDGFEAAGSKAPHDAVPDLIRALKNGSADTRSRAADELGHFGAAAVSAVPALMAALRSKSPRIRASASLALGNIGGDSGAVVPLLAKALKDENIDVRYAATLALSRIGTPAAREALKNQAGEDARRAIEPR